MIQNESKWVKMSQIKLDWVKSSQIESLQFKSVILSQKWFKKSKWVKSSQKWSNKSNWVKSSQKILPDKAFQQKRNTWTFWVERRPNIRVTPPRWKIPQMRHSWQILHCLIKVCTDVELPNDELANSKFSKKWQCHLSSTNRCKSSDRQNWEFRP